MSLKYDITPKQMEVFSTWRGIAGIAVIGVFHRNDDVC